MQNSIYVTPGGNSVRRHDDSGNDEEYMLGKGHTSETVDGILGAPVFTYPSKHGDTSTGGKVDATVVIGPGGDWAMINQETEKVIELNDRLNPRQKLPPGKGE